MFLSYAPIFVKNKQKRDHELGFWKKRKNAYSLNPDPYYGFYATSLLSFPSFPSLSPHFPDPRYVNLRAKEGGMEKTVFASAPFFSLPVAPCALSPVICVGGRPIPIVWRWGCHRLPYWRLKLPEWGALASTTATAAKALFQLAEYVKCRRISQELISWGVHSSLKREKNSSSRVYVLLKTSNEALSRRNRAVTAKKYTKLKSVMHVQSCSFAYLNPLLFWRSRRLSRC